MGNQGNGLRELKVCYFAVLTSTFHVMVRSPLSVVPNPQNHILKHLDDPQDTQHLTDSNLPSSKRKRVMFDASGMIVPPSRLNCSATACGKTRDKPQHA